MSSALGLLVVFLALIIAAVLAFCLPAWVSVSITFAAVLMVAIGGAALLAKASIAGAVVGVVVYLWRRHLRRRAIGRMPAGVKLVAIPEAKTKQPQAERSRIDRRAA